jgi:hypothetical protein
MTPYGYKGPDTHQVYVTKPERAALHVAVVLLKNPAFEQTRGDLARLLKRAGGPP